MKWNYKEIRKRIWNTTFKKGIRPWLLLVVVAFIFAFIGASDSYQLEFINSVDEFLGLDNNLSKKNIKSLKNYVSDMSIVKDNSYISADTAKSFTNSVAHDSAWMFKILAKNISYFERNKGEVLAFLIISSIIATLMQFLLLNITLVGMYRYAMEYRQVKEVDIRRIFAPFHKDTLGNLAKTILIYNLILNLWDLTIIGGYYKRYQYIFVPYLLAENPALTWKQARDMSKQMTQGYKWKIFLTRLSFIYVYIIEVIPIIGLLVGAPLEINMDVEMYFYLRNNPDFHSDLLKEPGFGEPAYVDKMAAQMAQAAYANQAPYTNYQAATIEEPTFVMENIKVSRPTLKGKNSEYTLVHYLFMFFLFSIIGWMWECGLYLVSDHMIVNRGTLYGPWIPIYGVGGAVMVLLLNRFKENKIKIIILEVLVCGILEYATSFVLDIIFNRSYWDYHTDFLNVNGRICIAGLTAFALGGLAAIYLIAPALSNFADKFSKKRQIICASILCGLFVLDIICCIVFGFNAGEGVGGNL